jgi:hypothetical protein
LPEAMATRFFTPGIGWRSGGWVGDGGMGIYSPREKLKADSSLRSE